MVQRPAVWRTFESGWFQLRVPSMPRANKLSISASWCCSNGRSAAVMVSMTPLYLRHDRVSCVQWWASPQRLTGRQQSRAWTDSLAAGPGHRRIASRGEALPLEEVGSGVPADSSREKVQDDGGLWRSPRLTSFNTASTLWSKLILSKRDAPYAENSRHHLMKSVNPTDAPGVSAPLRVIWRIAVLNWAAENVTFHARSMVANS